MRRPIQRLCLAAAALCLLGAKEEGCSTAPVAGIHLYCHTDPPVGCAAYCSGEDSMTFTPACSGVSAGPLEMDFELAVFAYVDDLAAQGMHFCPHADLSQYLTPCRMGIIPQEWPNQDHSVCTPAPWGCPV